jgi:hypothetical protein
MMKIGILILAHDNLEQLRLLVDSLKSHFTVFVHIDAKCDIPEDCFAFDSNVYVIKKHTLYWGNVTIVHATLELLKLAYTHLCDYYILISGADLRIQSCQKIREEISRNPEVNYFYYSQLPKNAWPLNGGFDRLLLYWQTLKHKEANTPYNLLCSLGRRIQKLLKLQRKLFPISYYGGSEWLNLSKEVVEYILDFVVKNPKYLEQFNHTVSSDEIFFQTIVMNSEFSSKVVNDDKRYIDWVSGPEYPRILRESDYDKIIHSSAFFARKFDERVDTEIIKKIVSLPRDGI